MAAPALECFFPQVTALLGPVAAGHNGRHRLVFQQRSAVSGETLADIGTDHAYLPAYLLQNGKIARAIAAVLRAGPLARAKVTARDAGCADRMNFRLCDGLRGLRREEADTVVIAGMGGETITHILAQAPWTDWTGMQLLLQPMSTQPGLRRWQLRRCKVFFPARFYPLNHIKSVPFLNQLLP